MVRATASSASRGEVTSTTCVITQSSPPISRRSLDDCPSHSGLMSIIDTRAPALTSASVMTRPNPIGLAAPVTIATLPASGRSCMCRSNFYSWIFIADVIAGVRIYVLGERRLSAKGDYIGPTTFR